MKMLTNDYTIKETAARFGVTPGEILAVIAQHKEEFNLDYDEGPQFTNDDLARIGMLLSREFRNQVIQRIDLDNII